MKKVILFVVAALTCFLTVQAQEVFQSKAWGFSMNIPESWLRADSAFTRDNVQEYDFSKEQLDKIFELQNRAIPLLALMKYDPEEYGGVIPTIKVNCSRIALTDQDVFLQSAKQTFDQLLKMLDNGRYYTEPVKVNINGVPMIYLAILYDLKNEGKIYHVRTYSYSVLRKGHFIQFNFTDIPSGENDQAALFKELVSSINFNKK